MKFQHIFFLVITSILFTSCGNNQVAISFKMLEAERLFKSGNFTEAKKVYTQIIHIAEEDQNEKYYCYYKKASCYFKLKNYKSSLGNVNLAMKAPPIISMYDKVMGNSLFLKGRIASRKGDMDAALNNYIDAIKYLNDNSFYNNVGYALIQLGKYELAIEALNKSIDPDPLTAAYPLSNRGLAYLKMGNFEKALKDFKESESIDSKNPYLFKHKALYYFEKKKTEAGCDALRKSKELEYKEFGDETDKNDVDSLLSKYCSKTLKTFN